MPSPKNNTHTEMSSYRKRIRCIYQSDSGERKIVRRDYSLIKNVFTICQDNRFEILLMYVKLMFRNSSF